MVLTAQSDEGIAAAHHTVFVRQLLAAQTHAHLRIARSAVDAPSDLRSVSQGGSKPLRLGPCDQARGGDFTSMFSSEMGVPPPHS